MLEMRSRRVQIRGYLYGMAATVLLFTMSGGATVSADGGQPELIHACILPIEDGGNVRIVGADESCPESTTPLHWLAGAQPEFESAEVPPPSEGSGFNLPKKVNKNLYGVLGIKVKVKQTKTVTKTLGPSLDWIKGLTVSCPGTHPFALFGSSSVVEPEYRPGLHLLSHQVGWHAWYVERKAWTYSSALFAQLGWKTKVTWTLKVEVECAKVAKVTAPAQAKAG